MFRRMNELIDYANAINEEVSVNKLGYNSETIKELKKIEMYCRKTYIMLVHTDKLIENDHSEETFLKDMTAALVRDQKYVKSRDSLDTYEIL